jgi:hypothetical protein
MPQQQRKTAERGYGGAHKARRAREAVKVQRGEAFCAKCGGWIPPGTPWDLGHHPADRTQYLGPMHQRCNRDTRLEKALRRPVMMRSSAEAWL